MQQRKTLKHLSKGDPWQTERASAGSNKFATQRTTLMIEALVLDCDTTIPIKFPFKYGKTLKPQNPWMRFRLRNKPGDQWDYILDKFKKYLAMYDYLTLHGRAGAPSLAACLRIHVAIKRQNYRPPVDPRNHTIPLGSNEGLVAQSLELVLKTNSHNLSPLNRFWNEKQKMSRYWC